MPRQNNRRNTRRNNRNANRSNNRSHAAQSRHRARRDSIIELVLSDSDHAASIVDSDEGSTSSLSSAAEDYIANLADNGDSSDLSDVILIGAPRETSPPPPVQHPAIIEGLLAYDMFSAPGRTEEHYICRPEKSSVVRLALHKAAEVLGATSESEGQGKDRRVVMTMDIGQDVIVSKHEFRGILEGIVENLFSVRNKRSGRERQGERKQRLQMERRQRKMGSFLEESTTTGNLRSNRKKKRGKTPEEKVGRANVGFGMLERMGWREGQGLGAGREGLREPLEAERRRTRAGLGC